MTLAKGAFCSVKLKPNVLPTAAKFQRLPFVLSNEVPQELHMLDSKCITSVDASLWVSQISVVQERGRLTVVCWPTGTKQSIIAGAFPLLYPEESLNLLSGTPVFWHLC